MLADIAVIEQKYISILSEIVDYMYTAEVAQKNNSTIIKHLPKMSKNLFKLTGYTIQELEEKPRIMGRNGV